MTKTMRACFRTLKFLLVWFALANLAFGQGVLNPFSGSDAEPDAASEEEKEALEKEREDSRLERRIAFLKEELEEAEAELARIAGDASKASSDDEAMKGPDDVDVPAGALVVVSSDESEGSGFIGRMRGRTFFITNIHVLGAARGARFATIDGTAVPLSDHAFLSKTRDIAMVPVEWEGPALEVSGSLKFDEVSIGDRITVMGNSSGARVATRLEGDIRGLGPDELEVSAKFVPGNSGSPIVHNELGTVIGVASHLRDFSERSKWTEDSELGDIRRFGFRLDGDIAWEQFSLEAVFEQSEIYHRFEDRTFALWHISHMLEHRSQLMTNYRNHASLGYMFENIDEGFDWRRGIGSGHNQQILRRFLTRMTIEVQKDLRETEEALRIGFFKERFDQISEARDHVLRSVENFRNVRL